MVQVAALDPQLTRRRGPTAAVPLEGLANEPPLVLAHAFAERQRGSGGSGSGGGAGVYLRLAQLEAELTDHIHLENNVLFCRVLAT